MLNYRSVRSSEAQVRSNPALKHCSSAFQKRAETLLEDIQPTFPTFARITPKHETVLSRHQFHAFTRPAHLRSQWILLHDTLPTILLDPKGKFPSSVIRIPSRKLALQSLGTILCEGAWDAQDHRLWIWDVVYWNRANVAQSEPYSVRYEYLKELLTNVLDVGNPMSDAEVVIPTFVTIQSLLKEPLGPSLAVEFQPEKEGQRRLSYIPERMKHTGNSQTQIRPQPQPHPQPQLQPQARLEPSLAPIIEQISEAPPVSVKPEIESTFMLEEVTNLPAVTTVAIQTQISTKTNAPEKLLKQVLLQKDTKTKLPDTYRIFAGSADKGLLAIRSLDMSRKLRELFQKRTTLQADVEWHEPFQKYDLKQLYLS